MNALLVAGTASDAGKSVITAGICSAPWEPGQRLPGSWL